MNKDTFEGQYKQFQGEFKKQWGKLTDDAWTEISGNKDKLLGKIQETYGKSKQDAERDLADFTTRLTDRATNDKDSSSSSSSRSSAA